MSQPNRQAAIAIVRGVLHGIRPAQVVEHAEYGFTFDPLPKDAVLGEQKRDDYRVTARLEGGGRFASSRELPENVHTLVLGLHLGAYRKKVRRYKIRDDGSFDTVKVIAAITTHVERTKERLGIAIERETEAERQRLARLQLAREARRVFGAPNAFRHEGHTDEDEQDAALRYRPVGIEDICELTLQHDGAGIELHVKGLAPETVTRLLLAVRQASKR